MSDKAAQPLTARHTFHMDCSPRSCHYLEQKLLSIERLEQVIERLQNPSGEVIDEADKSVNLPGKFGGDSLYEWEKVDRADIRCAIVAAVRAAQGGDTGGDGYTGTQDDHRAFDVAEGGML